MISLVASEKQKFQFSIYSSNEPPMGHWNPQNVLDPFVYMDYHISAHSLDGAGSLHLAEPSKQHGLGYGNTFLTTRSTSVPIP